VSELAEVAAQEKSLLDQSRDLLSTVAALHVSNLAHHFLDQSIPKCARQSVFVPIIIIFLFFWN
jgi:hypothetical protein